MKNFGIAIHGGASDATFFLKNNLGAHEEGLAIALKKGYEVLKKGGSALAAVEEAVKLLEDNPVFNAGRGSALNCKGEVEMDAAIMDGKRLYSGAVSMVKNVKNPITLAKNVMLKTSHVFLSGYGALDLAKLHDVELAPDAYFVTTHQVEDFLEFSKKETLKKIMEKKVHGTVGAVALDKKGNLAAATSTGGTSNCLPGRIGDSCVIGAGCYANNNTCAVSGTGDGEVLINNVIANTISMILELKKSPLQEICDYVILKRKRPDPGKIGVISIDSQANIGISYNCEIMKRGWMTSKGDAGIKIFGK